MSLPTISAAFCVAVVLYSHRAPGDMHLCHACVPLHILCGHGPSVFASPCFYGTLLPDYVGLMAPTRSTTTQPSLLQKTSLCKGWLLQEGNTISSVPRLPAAGEGSEIADEEDMPKQLSTKQRK